MSEKHTVLILGATGLFGGLLVKRLIREGQFDVVCAGRTETALKAFCDEFGGRFRTFDRDDETRVALALDKLTPLAVVDCAGPFQYYGDDPYCFARQVVGAGCHYLDIADAGDFVAGIGELDALAKSNNVAAISGASSTPAISAAVSDSLTKDMGRVISIDSAIIPGNRARRTLSVMKAVLGQVGQQFEIVRHGRRETVKGWGETRTINLDVDGKPAIRSRLASLVNTPDLALFPERYSAETVTFRAGLEIRTFHRALVFGRWLVSGGLLRSLAPFSGLARWIASWFEQWGSDVGGMKVSVLGETVEGQFERREWDLIADDGQGPEIPTIPVSILLDKLAKGDANPGARPSPGEVSLVEVEQALQPVGAKAQLHVTPARPVFKQVLGETFETLPAPIRDLHNRFGQSVYEGMAVTKGPSGLFGRMASWVIGFPSGRNEVPVRVTITADEHGETWIRAFDGKPFSSRMSVNSEGVLQERFGPFAMNIALDFADGKFHYPVTRGKLFGKIPIPSFLLPKSLAFEEVDGEGRFTFDVLIKFPVGGRIAHYQGWLVRRD